MNLTLTNLTLPDFIQNSSDELTALTFLMYIHFFLGFSLNCYIIFLILFKRGRADVSVVFTLNHSAAELYTATFSFVYVIFLDNICCFVVKLVDVLFWTSMSARLLFLCCVCLERYLAVVHPVTFLRMKPLRYRVGCSVLVWIFSLMLGINSLTSVLFKILIIVYVIVLAVELFCCVAILRRLRDPGPRDIGREQGEMNAAKKKAFQIVSINLLTCLAQNIPLAVMNILKTSQLGDNISTAYVICMSINMFAGMVQPVMILHKIGKLSFIKCS